MATDADARAADGGAFACPVCGEAFATPPARCFRCETDLSSWWPLHDSLAALGRGVGEAEAAAPLAEMAPARQRPRRPWVLPVVLTAGLLGALVLHLESTRPRSSALPTHPVSRPQPSTSSASPGLSLTPAEDPGSPGPAARSSSVPGAGESAPRATVRYVVQPGDSLWRIAAALEGDGRRWPDLIADARGFNPEMLRPGQELRLRVTAWGGPSAPATAARASRP